MSLAKAVAAFVAKDCDRTKMDVLAWAKTYHCGLDDVRAEWERQMTTKSQQAANSYEEPEGK